MRAEFILIPAAVIAYATPTQAKIFMTVKEAQRLMFPSATFETYPISLNERDARTQAWRVSTGEWFFIDRVFGKDDIITYAVALNSGGAVKQIEILECLADYDTITMPEWRAQFVGRSADNAFNDIQTISGATLSSLHIADGVKHIVSTFALLIKSHTLEGQSD
jgi:hypothetical protein